MIPNNEQAEQHLEAILERGSVNLGAAAGSERLMLLLTRICELRCNYCFVGKDGPEMPLSIARRGIDLLMRTTRPRLELQLFGGEPTRCWDVLSEAITYARDHEALAGRRLEIVMTTNGLHLTDERIAFLSDFPIVVMLSMDGDADTHRRYRPGFMLQHDEAYERTERTVDRLQQSGLNWFVNAVLPPAASDCVPQRYAWAKRRGIERLQINYAVGMQWTTAQMDAYLAGLVESLRENHNGDDTMVVFDWNNDCEPVILSEDLIVDVEGTLYHDAAIFLEKGFGRLKDTFKRGHVDDTREFDPLRLSLREIHRRILATYPADSREHFILKQNAMFGAKKDLSVRLLAEELGCRTAK